MLDLYARVWIGNPLGRNDYVISADEKTSIQACCRCHPTLPACKARQIRVNHDYHRRGAVAYLAAYDVHHAKVFGRCEDTTGIVAFTDLVVKVITQEPYKSADRVFWIVDNASSHRGRKAIDRLAGQFPNAVMVHTPGQASWLNQIEINFSIAQRKVLSPNDFTDLDVVVDRLYAFETLYNQTARPFKWKFTTTETPNTRSLHGAVEHLSDHFVSFTEHAGPQQLDADHRAFDLPTYVGGVEIFLALVFGADLDKLGRDEDFPTVRDTRPRSRVGCRPLADGPATAGSAGDQQTGCDGGDDQQRQRVGQQTHDPPARWAGRVFREPDRRRVRRPLLVVAAVPFR